MLQCQCRASVMAGLGHSFINIIVLSLCLMQEFNTWLTGLWAPIPHHDTYIAMHGHISVLSIGAMHVIDWILECFTNSDVLSMELIKLNNSNYRKMKCYHRIEIRIENIFPVQTLSNYVKCLHNWLTANCLLRQNECNTQNTMVHTFQTLNKQWRLR